MTDLRTGLVLDWVHGTDVPVADQIAEQTALLEAGRDAFGLGMMTSGQHFLPDGLRFLQPVPFLASMAERFPDMRVATAILLLPLLHPVEVAEQLATLDVMSGGRVVFGAGLGYTDREFELFGIDRKERTARLEESIGLIRALWSGEPVHHRGRFWQVDAEAPVVLPVQEGGPPVWVGGGAPASAKRAARIGDTFYPPPFVDHATLRELHDLYLATRRELGRPDPTTVPIRRDLYLADSVEEAAARIEPFVNGRSRTYLKWGMGNEGAVAEAMQQESQQEDTASLGQRLLLGPPDVVAAELDALRRDVGMTDFVLRVQWPGMPVEESIEQLGRFGEVLPLMRT